ncbi:MAG: restriction endonuclease subunit S, partial [Treponema sp.]|nr:restriction endonuclease subunit S [Treponema sp.]
DLLISLTGNVGRVAVMSKEFLPAALNQRVTCLRIKKSDKVNYKYLYYYLLQKSFQKECIKASKGVAQLNLSTRWLETYNINIPKSFEEQNRIVTRIEGLLNELNEGTLNLIKIKAQLKIYRQAILKKAFEKKEGWRTEKLSEIGDVNLGRQRSPKNISNKYPTKYIRAANITENGFDLTDILDMEFSPIEKEKYILQENDILLSEASGSPTQVGKPAIWKNEIENCCFQNTVIRHRVKKDLPEYVYWYYKMLYINGFFSRNVGGVGINHLGATNFSNFEINIPSTIVEQKEIVKEIEEQFSLCEKLGNDLEILLEKSEQIRQSILKKAFEGEL